MGVKIREKPKGSGVWWVFINHMGKRKSKRIGKDKRLAMEVAKQIEARLLLGEMGIIDDKQSVPTFLEYSKLWLSDIKGIRRESTFIRYNNLLTKHIYNSDISNKPINQIKRSDIKILFICLYKQGLSKSSVCLIRCVISGVMSHAVDAELIKANPATGIIKQLNMEKSKRITVEPMNSEEVVLFLITCLEEYPEYHPFFLTGFRTGLRLGELLALEWRDIDWNGQFIWVRRSYGRGRINQTKNDKQRRVDMSNQLKSELEKLHKIRMLEALKEGQGNNIVDIIFHHDGNHYNGNFIRQRFKWILRRAGIRDLRLHDMRHTFASLLLSKGYSPVYVKEQLGHQSIRITVDVYGHLIPGDNRAAVNSLDDAPKRTSSAPKKISKAVSY